MRTFLLPFAIVLALSIPAEADDKEALAKARILFPAFKESVYTDKEKADEAFEPFLTMPKLVQKRLSTWLDSEYEKKKIAYERAKHGGLGSSSGGRSSAPSASPEIKTLRAELEKIRKMGNEDEMKKELKSSGWSAMEKLLRLTKERRSKTPSAPKKKIDPKIVEKALNEALRVGEYRFEIKRKMSHFIPKPEKDLGIEGTSDEREEVETAEAFAGRTRAVFSANEKLKSKISQAEYDGVYELNLWRIAAGMGVLTIDPKLCDASRDHSKDMAEKNFFAHDSPIKGKKTPWDRAKNFGTSANAENIAINGSVSGANKAWFFSPGHHKNMLNPNVTVIGLGIHGRHYTQMFRR